MHEMAIMQGLLLNTQMHLSGVLQVICNRLGNSKDVDCRSIAACTAALGKAQQNQARREQVCAICTSSLSQSLLQYKVQSKLYPPS